MGETLRSR